MQRTIFKYNIGTTQVISTAVRYSTYYIFYLVQYLTLFWAHTDRFKTLWTLRAETNLATLIDRISCCVYFPWRLSDHVLKLLSNNEMPQRHVKLYSIQGHWSSSTNFGEGRRTAEPRSDKKLYPDRTRSRRW